PDNQLREWLESIGVKFGANLNAYTSIDQTVYNISNVPVARTSVQDSCLLILHDWANDLTLDPAEIDKERGVIHEEWRRSMQGQMRIMEKALPLLYPDTKYGERLPIGTMEIVDNFPPQALRDYYETWYRPDQQAIIVVGDIDVDRIEGKIKEMFSSIEMPANPKERTYQPVPDHKGTLFAIGSDPEQKQYVASLMILNEKFPRELRNTPAYYLDSFIKTMAASMLNNRLNDLSNDPKAPFANAGFDFGDYIISKNKGAVDIQTVAKGNDIIVPLQTVYREVLRAARHGFTQSELDRTLQMYLTAYERAYNNRASAENESFVGEYVNHFLDNEPIPGIEVEWPMMRQIASMVTLDDINRLMASAITPENRSVLVMAPEKDEITLPTPDQISEALAAVDAETIEAYTDNVKNEPLIAKAPVPGKIVSTRHDDQWDATVWTLSNGATVYVKPTKYKEDEIRFTASAMGGYSDYPTEYAPTILTLPNILNMYGLGSYSSTELRKYLAGKIAGIGMSFGPYSRSISGSTTPRDLPTLMELTYMAFTDTQFDPTEFESMQSSLTAM
ncbi:MAG: insulinase family protein, partial [Duncaniella sp.]|nr:insulinase family protein [Duncaniella sp.]